MRIMNKIYESLGFQDKNAKYRNDDITPITPENRYHHFSRLNQVDMESEPTNTYHYPSESSAYSGLIIHSPSTFEESKKVISSLQKKEASLISLSALHESEIERTIYFLSGATYALNGKMNRIQGDLFLFSPSSLKIKKI